MLEKPGFPAHSAVSWEAWQNAGMRGWGGRDRTSEWGNQNPLPYRLATPQQAASERARPRVPTPVRQRRSIDGVRPFQQANDPNFTRNQPSLTVPFI
jgi:hypothetical protein